MSFNKFDLLSNAPKNFIFQNHSNKTNFGGVLTVALLISALIIFAYYLIYFITEDDYSIQYARYLKILSQEEKEARRISPIKRKNSLKENMEIKENKEIKESKESKESNEDELNKAMIESNE